MTGKIQRDDFFNSHILSNIKTDTTGYYGLFFDYTADRIDNRYKKKLMSISLNGNRIQALDLPFEADDFSFRNQEVILKQNQENGTVFYSYDTANGACDRLFTIPLLVDQFYIGESKCFFTAEIHGTTSSTAVKCCTRGPFFKEGGGVIDDGVMALFQSNYSGHSLSRMSSLALNIDKVDFDLPNGRIIFSAFNTMGFKPVESSIYSCQIHDETVKLLLSDAYRISYIQSMSENSILFMGVDLRENSRNDNQQIYQIHTGTGEVHRLGDLLNQSNENLCIVTDSLFAQSLPVQRHDKYFYFKQVTRDSELLCRISLDGIREDLVDGMKSISSFTVTDRGILLTGLRKQKLSELYFHDGKRLQQITQQNQWLEEKRLSVAEKLHVLVDKVEIDGYVYPPVDVKKGRLYPAVLMIHGGPKMLYSDVYSHDIQLLCANDYYVFNANPMGSDGRGDDFSNIRGQFGRLPYKQLMAFTDKVLDEYPQIDGNRLGVTGGSYGGYMTNYIITRTHRFKAAVSERGISNLMTAFTSSEIGPQFVSEYMGNKETPWSNPTYYLEESPISSVGNVKTPTLFIHGKNDYTCHYSESLNMFSALSYLGIETKFCLFEDEGHGVVVCGKPLNKLRRFHEMLLWYNKYLEAI